MSKIKKIFINARVIIWLAFILFAFVAIDLQNKEGIVIKGVEEDGVAFNGGISNPSSELQPTQYEKILSVNNKETKTLEDYAEAINENPLNNSIRKKTKAGEYVFLKSSNDLGLSVGNAAGSNIRK